MVLIASVPDLRRLHNFISVAVIAAVNAAAVAVVNVATVIAVNDAVVTVINVVVNTAAVAVDKNAKLQLYILLQF